MTWKFAFLQAKVISYLRETLHEEGITSGGHYKRGHCKGHYERWGLREESIAKGGVTRGALQERALQEGHCMRGRYERLVLREGAIL